MVTVILTMLMSAMASSELRIATVDMQKAIQTVEAGKKARTELESEFNKRKLELQAEEAEIKKLHEDFQKKALALNEKSRIEKQKQIQERVMKLQQKTAQSQQEISARQNTLTEPIVTKLRKMIKEIAEKKGYQLVLESNENLVLYKVDKDDLTQELIQTYNLIK